MFGLLIPGRLVDTGLEAVDETKFTFTVLNPSDVNHVAVFLTGEVPLPEGYGASVYLCWPDPEPNWVFLGAITNEAPSSLFRIAKIKPTAADGSSHPFGAVVFDPSQHPVEVAQIGISIEPLADIQQAMAASDTDVVLQSDIVQFVNFAVESLFNFVASFGVDAQQDGSGDTWFPLSAVHRWRDRLEARLSHDPVFWRK